jgi:hypothetical protein
MSRYVSAGDFLFDPDQLAFAFVEVDSEGLHVRLGFTGQGDAGTGSNEIRLDGIEARGVLRWLRGNAEFLDQGGPIRRIRPVRPAPGHDGCALC